MTIDSDLYSAPDPFSIRAATADGDPAPHGYAGFRPRLLALVVDSIVLVPVTLLAGVALASSRTAAIFSVLPLSLLVVAYSVVMHALGGQTLGKMAARIRVVTPKGTRISWRQALLRSAAAVVFALIDTIVNITTLSRAPASTWEHAWRDLYTRLSAFEPSWVHYLHITYQLWFFSELLVFLWTPHRRALHDLIAGTVVVRTRA